MSDQPAGDNMAPFSEVFNQEMEDLRARRQAVQGPPWERAQAESSAPEDQKVRTLRREALEHDLVGLALSGGGIRSATFCLGILQGLADLGLLKSLDYLSTVSGGGYIGGWLTAWIKREGDLGNVERQLRSSRIEQARARRWTDAPTVRAQKAEHHVLAGPVLDDEPEPVRHLRAYSNYLAPRPGLFSADGWVLLAIYLRNLLLNQLVYVHALLALLFAMLVVVKLFAAVVASAEGGPGDWPWWVQVILVLFGLFFLGACVSIFRSLLGLEQSAEERAAHSVRPRKALRHLHEWIAIPLLAAALLFSLFLIHLVNGGIVLLTIPIGSLQVPVTYSFLLAFGVGFGLFHAVFNLPSSRKRPATSERAPGWPVLAGFLGGFLGGALGGGLVYVLLHWTESLKDAKVHYVPAVVTLMPPLLLTIFVLSSFVQVGVQGRLLGEPQREWWASLSARIMMYAVGWLLLFATVVFGPYLLLWAGRSGMWGGWLNQLLLGGGWVGSVAAGLRAARSSRTGPEPPSTQKSLLLDGLARIAPALFLIGMLMLLALLATTIIHGQAPCSPQAYLRRLNSSLPPSWLGTPQDMLKYGWPWAILIPLVCALVAAVLAWILGRWVDINLFSLQGLYGNRLARCYLGASRRKPTNDQDRPPGAAMDSRDPVRAPDPVTGFDPLDDLPLHLLQMGQPGEPEDSSDAHREHYWGPLHIINTALNLTWGEELAWQERKAESFILTAHHCGSSGTGYRPTCHYAGGLRLGTALGISGAAVSPNMGYHSSTAVTALLTLFNARLGAWLGNPRHHTWKDPGPRSGLLYLLNEILGRTDARAPYVYLSDGGHFENLGVYELIRRRCRFIIVCDADADPDFEFADLGGLIRKVRVDFGVRIEIDPDGIRPRGPERRAASHVAIGKIFYGDVDRPPEGPADDVADPSFHPKRDEGLLVYIKPTLTGDEPPDVENYAIEHPTFPHQTTINQFFNESQFESYRALGFHACEMVFRPVVGSNTSSRAFFAALYERWFPQPPDFTQTFWKANVEYAAIQQSLRSSPSLRFLCAELYPEVQSSGELLASQGGERDASVRNAELHMILQMLSVLENTWLGLHLDRYWRHPVHSGWKEVFRRWLSAPTVLRLWPLLHPELSHAFVKFIEREVLPSPDSQSGPSQEVSR